MNLWRSKHGSDLMTRAEEAIQTTNVTSIPDLSSRGMERTYLVR